MLGAAELSRMRSVLGDVGENVTKREFASAVKVAARKTEETRCQISKAKGRSLFRSRSSNMMAMHPNSILSCSTDREYQNTSDM